MGKVIRPFCWHQNLVPWGLSAPAPGLHVLNHEKTNCIKFDFKDVFLFVFLNLQQMNEVTRHICWHQNFVPRVLSAPANEHLLYKIRLQGDVLKLTTYHWSDKRFVTKWIKSCLLSCFGTFKMPILMFNSIFVFRPEGQIRNPVRRDTRICIRRILNASRISKTQSNSCTISPS